MAVNVDIQDRIINSQTEKIRNSEFAQDVVRKEYVKYFDKQAGLKAIRWSHLGTKNSSDFIKKREYEIKKVLVSPSIKRTKFPLTLAWASTVHKFQGSSLEQSVTEFDIQKQNSFGSGQTYTSLMRVKAY